MSLTLFLKLQHDIKNVQNISWVAPINYKNKDENAHRYAVRGGRERERELEKHTVMKNITRKGYYDTKGGQEKVTYKSE